jgi:putative membrane protein
MLIVGLVLAGLAAVLHAYIFWMESFAWDRPRTRQTFGLGSDEQVQMTKPMAFNQGFYNLFLAIAVFVGIVGVAAGATAVGGALVLTGTGSMLAAALVLLLSDRTKARAAITQGTLPLLAVVATTIGLLLQSNLA